ncbi:MtrB/PioB family decaheme-associated outer membrane protein [Ferrimonas balearica]|uniref:MtrB/PioB family decaheme-associated outer membrane protein n=1 Tax=Ferrimonas balearica TaxID=44012 RepID=UPI001C58FE7C|nr:MtrB/PioB family decaheme-associated outer membrane protein [Ferrimonas balearica]MBW3138456.1 MtrB/PioB family decaheme-associated outer membrane protein [Ferrimonas balearica]
MNFRLNLITLALASFSGAAMANYGLANANLEKVDTTKWECKRCEPVNGYQGSVGVGGGAVITNDNHAANRFGGNEDGGVGELNADVRYNAESGYNASILTDRLGTGNGSANVSVGKAGVANAEFNYRTLTTWQEDNAFSQYVANGSELVNTGSLVQQDLKLERERYGFAFDVGGELWETYANFQREDKTGTKSRSVAGLSATNIVAPVDSTTDRWEAGAKLTGQNWFTGVSYIYSQYDNNLATSLTLDNNAYALANDPSNEAYQVVLNGAYSLNRTHFAGRVVSGKMTQDDDTLKIGGIAGFDGEVRTLDANFRVASSVTNRLRLTASYDHSDRDNRSTVLQGDAITVDGLSGDVEGVKLYDTTRNTYKVGASYRIASGYRLDGGYDRKDVERTEQDREKTNEDTLWARLRVTSLDNWDFGLKAGYSNRDGSKYDANRGTSEEDNALLRRYYLADRERVETELRITHTPIDTLSIDFTGRYAEDDYSESEIGLTEAKDYGYDLGLNWAATEHLNLHAFGGQQWIESAQAGSTVMNGTANWFADVEDEFIHAGLGFSYAGLMADKLVIGGDYLYADSTSDTVVSQGISMPYDDYYATSHSINFYGDYAFSEKMSARLDYMYERYQDSDYAEVGVSAVPGLTTLGYWGHNYNAHMVMVSFKYAL